MRKKDFAFTAEFFRFDKILEMIHCYTCAYIFISTSNFEYYSGNEMSNQSCGLQLKV